MTPRALRLATALLCASAAGCSLLAPLPDRSRFFNLAPLASAPTHQESQHGATASALIYGLGPVMLPSYLDRKEIVTRLSPTEVTYSATERWAEPLPATFTAVLLQDLSILLGTNHIFSFPWTAGERVDYQIVVTVLRFDNDASGNARLVARWRVRDALTGADRVAAETNVTHARPVGGDSARIAALSDAVYVLAHDIAGALRRLPPTPRPPPAH